MSIHEIVTTSNQLIARGKTGEAINQLLHFAEDGYLDKQLTENLLLLSSRYNSLKQNNIIGIITNSDFHIASNQITHALLELINDISEFLLNPESSYEKENHKNSQNSSSNQIVINGNVSESTITIGNKNKINDGKLSTLIQELTLAVEKMAGSLPADEAKRTSHALETIVSQSKSETPNREWWEVSVDGLSKAAKNLGKIGEPVLEILAKVAPILLSMSK